ncbi:MAG: DUF72 domain-containing protein [Candidatus Abyssubacteria bacterium]
MKNHPSNLHIGTDSWSHKDWEGVFYHEGTKQADYLVEYATHYSTVEVDSTFYRIPSEKVVTAWRDKTPEGFIFSAKVPRAITHWESDDAKKRLAFFLSRMGQLGDKLGPLLFQFRYYSKSEITGADEFIERMRPILADLPKDYRFALETRNKDWLTEKFLGVLRKYQIALALTDHPWMEKIDRLMERLDVVTADFCYIRWLGDRKKIRQQTDRFDTLIVDRSREMNLWLPAVKQLLDRDIPVFGYFSNHYAGYAPGSIELFEKMWASLFPNRSAVPRSGPRSAQRPS